MAVQYTYDSTTRREELSGLVTILSPQDTPIMSLCEHVPVQNTLFEFLMDDVVAPTAVNAQLEGAVIGAANAANRTRQRAGNIVMIDWLAVSISRTQQIVNEAGIENEYDYQVGLKGLELLKRGEANMTWSSYVAGTASTARQTAGIIQVIASTGFDTTAGASIAGFNVPDKFSAYWFDQTDGALTEAEFQTVLQNSWERGNDISANILFCGGAVKRILSAYGTVYSSGAPFLQRTIPADAMRIPVTYDVYESDFGAITIALNRFMNSNFESAITEAHSTPGTFLVEGEKSFFAIDPNYWKIAVLDSLHHEQLGKVGDSDMGFVRMEIGVKYMNPIASFGASGITS